MLIRDLVCAAVAPHYEDFQFYAGATTTNKYLPRQRAHRVTTSTPRPRAIVLLMSLTLLARPSCLAPSTRDTARREINDRPSVDLIYYVCRKRADTRRSDFGSLRSGTSRER